MRLQGTWQRVNDFFWPPGQEELAARYEQLVKTAQEWARQDFCYLTPAQMKSELSALVDLDLDEIGEEEPVRITLGPVSGGFGAGFLEALFDKDEAPAVHYLIKKIIIPVSDVGVSLAYPGVVVLEPDDEGNAVLFQKIRDYRDFDPEAFKHLEEQIDDGYEYGYCSRLEGMELGR